MEFSSSDCCLIEALYFMLTILYGGAILVCEKTNMIYSYLVILCVFRAMSSFLVILYFKRFVY